MDIEIILLDIYKNALGLSSDRALLYGSNVIQPKDKGMFFILDYKTTEIVGTSKSFDSVNNTEELVTNTKEFYNAILKSVDNSALINKGKLITALNTYYSLDKQSEYGFSISPTLSGIINETIIESQIAYKIFTFQFSVFTSHINTYPVDYYNTYENPVLTIEQ